MLGMVIEKRWCCCGCGCRQCHQCHWAHRRWRGSASFHHEAVTDNGRDVCNPPCAIVFARLCLPLLYHVRSCVLNICTTNLHPSSKYPTCPLLKTKDMRIQLLNVGPGTGLTKTVERALSGSHVTLLDLTTLNETAGTKDTKTRTDCNYRYGY